MRPISSIAVHHSASLFGDAAIIRGWHTAKGWKDIGYHKIVLNGQRTSNGAFKPGECGAVEAGRPEAMVGAHVKGHNTGSLGICFIGNFDLKRPDTDQLLGGARQIAEWCRAYKIPSSAVFGHREYSGHESNHCPGTLFPLDELREMVHNLLVGLTYPPREIARTRHPRVGRWAVLLWSVSLTLGIVVYLLLNVLY